jgi:hypothetical protein
MALAFLGSLVEEWYGRSIQGERHSGRSIGLCGRGRVWNLRRGTTLASGHVLPPPTGRTI